MGKEKYQCCLVESDLGVRNLIIAMIRHTSQDVHYGSRGSKISAGRFLNSEWFNEIIEYLNLDPKRVKWLIYNKKASQRRSYE